VKLTTIREPDGLFVVRSGKKFVLVEGQLAPALSSESATPFRAYLLGGVHYIHIPAGDLDVPLSNTITVLAERGPMPMVADAPNPGLGWTKAE
jgi:hypothetical protein